eukprot:COSAG01_NODE_30251_length_619_cov_4.159615_2_plen_78_part_00
MTVSMQFHECENDALQGQSKPLRQQQEGRGCRISRPAAAGTKSTESKELPSEVARSPSKRGHVGGVAPPRVGTVCST